LALALLAMMVPALAQTPPQMGHYFWGSVLSCTLPLPEGTPITARIQGTTLEYHALVDAQGEYWVKIPADNPDTPGYKEGGADGDIIEFYVTENAYLAATYPFAISGNTELDLVLPCQTITATVGSEGGGVIEPAGEVAVPYGATQAFTMTPEVGYKVTDVLVDGQSVGAVESYEFVNVTADHTIEAFFGVAEHTLTTATDGHGTIEPAGPITVTYFITTALQITPNTGYVLEDVLVNGTSVITDVTVDPETGVGTYELGGVLEDTLVEATFRALTFTVSTATDGNGAIEPAGPLTVTYDDDTTFTITPNPGYGITDVTVNGVSVLADVTIDPQTGVGTYTLEHVVADTEVVATFSRSLYRLYLPLVMR
jgi:DNA-binding protein YbaB